MIVDNKVVNLNEIIEQAVQRGESRIYIDEGIYVIDRSINLGTSDVDVANRKTIDIIGAGMKKTIIYSVINDGSFCFVHDQSLEQAKANSFGRGLKIKDLSIIGKSESFCGGIKLLGAFFYEIKNVQISLMKKEGILIPSRSDLNNAISGVNNSDCYANAYGKISNVVIQGCTGWGYKNELWGSSPYFENCMISDNRGGGIQIACPSAKITKCKISNNGQLTFNDQENEVGGGILIKYNEIFKQTPHNNLIESCEIDTNNNYQIWFNGSILDKVERCRFIDREVDRKDHKEIDVDRYHSYSIIKFGGDSGRDTQANVVENSFVRLDSNKSIPGMTLFDFSTKSSYCEVRRTLYSTGGNPIAVISNANGGGNIVTNAVDIKI